MDSILNDDTIVIPFTPTDETYRLKGEIVKTGNKLMPKTCTWCSFKEECWKNAEYAPKVTSKAKFPPMAWYTKLKNRQL